MSPLTDKERIAMPNPKLEQNTIRATCRIVTPMFCGRRDLSKNRQH